MKFKHINEENLRRGCKDCIAQALKLYNDNDYDDLEELLRVEWQNAQDRAVLLNKMYSEISIRNILTNPDIDESYEES